MDSDIAMPRCLGVVCQILVETKQIGSRAKFFHPSTGLLMYVAVQP